MSCYLDINEADLAPAGVVAVRDTGGAAGGKFVGVDDSGSGKARARASAPRGHAPEEQRVPWKSGIYLTQGCFLMNRSVQNTIN